MRGQAELELEVDLRGVHGDGTSGQRRPDWRMRPRTGRKAVLPEMQIAHKDRQNIEPAVDCYHKATGRTSSQRASVHCVSV